MINGMHAIVFSPEAEKVRDFFADVLGLSSVDAGGGWLIFALPPAELAVHPSRRGSLPPAVPDVRRHRGHARRTERQGCRGRTEVSDQRWGLVAAIRLPDGTEFPSTSPGTPRLIDPGLALGA